MAALVLTTLRGVPRGHAELMKRVGAHFVEDISNYLGFRGLDTSVVDEAQFQEAYRRLAAAGYELQAEDVARATAMPAST